MPREHEATDHSGKRGEKTKPIVILIRSNVKKKTPDGTTKMGRLGFDISP